MDVIDAVVAAAEAGPRVLGVTLGGSGAAGTGDEYSDVDLVAHPCSTST